MAETLSLMEFLQALLTDAGMRGGFGDDPQGTLAAHGLADLTPADVHDALVLVQDTQTVDYSLDAATAPPPPPPAGDDHEAAVEYLARYLDGPQEAAQAEPWPDPDDPGGAAPLGEFGAGDETGYDTGYGAGSDLPFDDGGWVAPGTEPDHGLDERIDTVHDYPGHDEFDAFSGFADLTDHVADEVVDGHDSGPTLSEGA